MWTVDGLYVHDTTIVCMHSSEYHLQYSMHVLTLFFKCAVMLLCVVNGVCSHVQRSLDMVLHGSACCESACLSTVRVIVDLQRVPSQGLPASCGAAASVWCAAAIATAAQGRSRSWQQPHTQALPFVSSVPV